MLGYSTGGGYSRRHKLFLCAVLPSALCGYTENNIYGGYCKPYISLEQDDDVTRAENQQEFYIEKRMEQSNSGICMLSI